MSSLCRLSSSMRTSSWRCFRSPRVPKPLVDRWLCFQTVRCFTGEGWKTWEDWKAMGPKANIVIIGSPGSGKSTVAKVLGQNLNKPVLDVDEHVLEKMWGMPVATKLKQVGDVGFIEEEGNALLNIDLPEAAILSLSGSNPLHTKAMLKASQSGVVVFLDTLKETILRRLHQMKVDRIVGQKPGFLAQVLDYRQEFYERWYDVRIIVEDGETPEDIAEKVVDALDIFNNDEGFVSTRGGSEPGQYVSFFDAVLQGLAPDGGLYVRSKHCPRFAPGELQRMVDLDFRERAIRVLEKWIHPLDMRPQEIRKCVYKSYKPALFTSPDIAPIKKLMHNHYTLELFHGPTASFKDAALQLMPRFFAKAMAKDSDVSKYLIVVATTGDTGGAVLDGFRRHSEGARIGVLVLYPLNGISKIQHHQMTTMEGKNIKVVGVEGDFDFCQTAIKEIFNDAELETWLKTNVDCRLSAANSINWGRLLPQVVYHVSTYLEMVKMGHITFGDSIKLCVPTGNFGNILSAYYAKMMGIPTKRLICASNTNHVLTDFLRKGVYSLTGQKLTRTMSPSIDILQSSNLERLLFHLAEEDPKTVRQFYETLRKEKVAAVPNNVWESMQQTFLAGYATEDECMEVAFNTFRETGYMMDPHTTVGRAVALRVGDTVTPTVISGTAHFAKFIDKILPFYHDGPRVEDIDSLSVKDLIEKAEGLARQPKVHPQLEAMVNKPVLHHDVIPRDYQAITNLIKECARIL